MLYDKQTQDVQSAMDEILQRHGYSEDFLMEWIAEVSKDSKNVHIRGSFKHMELLRAKVFDAQNPTIEHIQCKNMPEGLDEDTYILIYRK